MLKSAHNRILAARFNFQNPQLLYRWSYQGMKITVRRVRKSSITLVISVWSDCSLIGSRIAVSNCGLQSSHEQTFHFEVFPGDSRMATCHCVYLIYMIALFLRWVNPSTRTHTFRLPSTMMWLCRFLVSADFVTYSWISYYARKVLSTSWSRLSPWWISCFHLDPNRIVSSAFQTCTFYEIVELPSLNPTWHPLVKTLAICRSSESFWNWSQYSSFLLNPLKFDGIASPHFCVAPYHMHHECTIA
jgi:hypothetical protein